MDLIGRVAADGGVDENRDALDFVKKPTAPERGRVVGDRAVSQEGEAVVGETEPAAVISAPQDDEAGEDAGASWVYRSDGNAWSPEAKLLPPAGEPTDRFGQSVAVSGDVAVVAAIEGATPEVYGSVYVYRHAGGVWSYEAELVPSDLGAQHFFGGAIGIDGDTIAVGASRVTGMGTETGLVYVYRFDGNSWLEESQLVASDGTLSDRFGTSVAVSEDVIVVGATGIDDAGFDTGGIYVYRRSGAMWFEEVRLTASDAGAGDFFGGSVDIDGETILAGAIYDDDLGGSSGAAYVFERSSGEWTQQAKLTAGDGEQNDLFGDSVGVSGGIVVIAARGDDDGGDSAGAAYLFRRAVGDWAQAAKLKASDAAPYDRFAVVAIAGETVLVGAAYSDEAATNAGAAYVFDVGEDFCAEDFNADGLIDITDLLTILDKWGPCSGCPQDLDADGVVGIDDMLMVLGVWGSCE